MIRKLASPRVLGALLTLSVAANIFLGSIVAGRFTGEAVQGFQAKRRLDALLETLPEDRRPLLRQALNAAMPEVRQNLQAIQAARSELAEEFSKPEPDQAKLDGAFLELQRHTTAAQAALQQAVKRAAMQLTPDERREIIATLKSRARPQAMPDF